MRNRGIIGAALIAVLATFAIAQVQPLSDEELLQLQTSVLMLKDGEQLVIRGDYSVQGNIVTFYLDRGSHPAYASVSVEMVDFEATRVANEQLQQERFRQERYYRLIEERRRRLLEEVEGRPVVFQSQAGTIVLEEAEQPAGEAGRAVNEFPPYSIERLADEPETWWRDEAARLFAALDGSNARIAELDRQHDELVMRINRAAAEEEAVPLREQLSVIRQQLLAERERARLIGNRLSDLSIIAEELGRPIDWLLPGGSIVIDESQPQSGMGATTGAEEYQIESTYNPAELADREDSWWAGERQRLEERINDTQNRSIALRSRYNDVLRERDTAESDAQKIQLNQQLQALERSIIAERDRLESARRALDSLVDAARQLGKEEALGLMRERGEVEQ